MKLLNFRDLKGELVRTVKTFPLPVFSGVAAALLAMYQNHLDYAARQVGVYVSTTTDFIVPVIFACIFAYLLFLAVDLFALTRKKSWYKHAGRILAAGATVAVYFTLFKDFKFWSQNDMMEFFILNLAGVLLVLVAPFLREKVKMQDYWNYLVHTLFAFVFTFVLFGILFAGVALLFTSIDFLFHVTIDGVYYFDAFLFITGLMASPFFLGNFPKDFKRLANEGNFLRILSEYFLVPLVIVYFVMLYIYTGKMVATWQWPEGGVAGWIIGFSMVGIFAYVFSYAIKEKSLVYVDAFKVWFFRALIPLTFVLFTALWFRIEAYGVTEWRYLGVAFGVWLLINAAYFVFTKGRDLRSFLVSLVVILMVAIYGGPISAFSVSKEHQIQRLVNHLANAGMIEENNVSLKKTASFDYKSDDVKEVYDISQYLIQHYGIKVLQERFDGELDALVVMDNNDWYGWLNKYLATLGFPADYYPSYVSDYNDGGVEYVTYNGDDGCSKELQKSSPEVWPMCAVNVRGFDYLFDVNTGAYNEVVVEGISYTVRVFEKYLVIEEKSATGRVSQIVKMDLENLSASLAQEYGTNAQSITVPQAKLNTEFVGAGFRGVFRLNNLGVVFEDGKFLRSEYVNGRLLLKRR